MRLPYAQRFDDFQKTAVDSILADYQQNSAGRFLLVVPTGGGKTITAVKSVNALFANNVFDHSKHRVLWVAHRDYLLTQADESFLNFESWYPQTPSFRNRVDFIMLSKAAASLNESDDYVLVIIDEAHHAAASSYLPLFAKANVGVLGLTATPSRHDGEPLDFERESFSIGFPDLVDLGIVLRPEVRVVDTGQTFDIAGFSDSELAKLDDVRRNAQIIDELLSRHDDYTKVVVYVGTVEHAIHLHQTMQKSTLGRYYDSLAYITGEENSRGLSREDFLNVEKTIPRSIVVNVDVLTEGYDDPTVNTVVMARPTNSKLVYMQAMGRASRHDPINETKKAYVVEVVDRLPNIRYRIDNRWLYADISDALEPAVEDRDYASEKALITLLNEIYDQSSVSAADRQFPAYRDKDRYSLLLFKVYVGSGSSRHIPILITNENRLRVCHVFNYLSGRIPYFVENDINTSSVFRFVNVADIEVLADAKNQRRVFEAMANSVSRETTTSALSPWITYFSFHHRRAPEHLSTEISEFLKDMVNADQIREMILASEYPAGAFLVRFPLPLNSFIGRILHAGERDQLVAVLDKVRALKAASAMKDHRLELFQMLSEQRLPIEAGLTETLKTIVRDEIRFSTPLD